MPDQAHRDKARECVACAVLTISDTRKLESDTSGTLIAKLLRTAGHVVVTRRIITDEPDLVAAAVLALCADASCQAVLLTGGTGLAPRDTTYEAVSSVFEKRIDGFGELFRMLSYDEVGSPAMLSRATAGVRDSTVVFSLPGSTGAVRLAMERLILPELGHLTALLSE